MKTHLSWTLPELLDAEFTLLSELVYREAGIHLGPAKKALVAGRLQRRLRELKLASFADYHARVLSDRTGAERQVLLEAICTHETSFLREPQHFDLLERTLYPEWQRAAQAGRRPKRVRAWSAGCSTGEEPFSIAMSLRRHLPAAQGWQLEVLATDLSTRALAAAERADWDEERTAQIPAAWREQFLVRGPGRLRAGDELRRLVRFAQLNLNAPLDASLGSFDLIFCRNVLIYFDGPSKTRVLQGLISRLHPAGHLFIGHAETLNGFVPRMRPVAPTVYTFAAEGSR